MRQCEKKAVPNEGKERKEAQHDQYITYDFFIKQTEASREMIRLRTIWLLIICGLSLVMSIGAVITILLQNFN